MQANQVVSGWDGKLYFVWLHTRERYESGTEHRISYREYILCTAKELGLPIIDIHKSVFAPHPDPLSLFNLYVQLEKHGTTARRDTVWLLKKSATD